MLMRDLFAVAKHSCLQ